MLKQCLFNILNSFDAIPTIFVFTDTSLSKDECERYLNGFKAADLRIIPAEDCFSFHKQKGNEGLLEFARKNPMGLKLASILQTLDFGKPVLYSDTDVIWFKDPAGFLEDNHSLSEVSLSYDFQPAYDNNLIQKAGLDVLLDPPYYCAGILLIRSFSNKFESILKRVLPVALKESNHFTEQTIFSYLQKESGPSVLDASKFCIALDDVYNLRPSVTDHRIARHYIGPVRHLFWRDAFFLHFKKFR